MGMMAGNQANYINSPHALQNLLQNDMSGEKSKKEEIREMQLQFLTIFLQTGPDLAYRTIAIWISKDVINKVNGFRSQTTM